MNEERVRLRNGRDRGKYGIALSDRQATLANARSLAPWRRVSAALSVGSVENCFGIPAVIDGRDTDRNVSEREREEKGQT